MAKSSPFEAVHRVLGANFSEYDGWLLPADYGDTAAESAALRQATAAFDLSSFGRISIKGADSEVLMDKLLADGNERCRDGKWIWAVICDGRTQDDDIVRVGKMGGAYTIFTRPAKRGKVLAAAEACTGEHDLGSVEITDITETTAMLAMYGPEALKRVDNIVPFDVYGIGEEGITSISIFTMPITIIRGGWLGTDGIELLCPASVAPMAAGAVAKYHKRENIVPAGMDCLERAMADKRID